MEQVLTEAQQAELDRQLQILRRGVVEIVPEEEFVSKLAHSIRTGRPLKVKRA